MDCLVPRFFLPQHVHVLFVNHNGDFRCSCSSSSNSSIIIVVVVVLCALCSVLCPVSVSVTLVHSFWLSCACQLAAKSVLFSTTLSSLLVVLPIGRRTVVAVVAGCGWRCCRCFLWSCHRSKRRNSMQLLGISTLPLCIGFLSLLNRPN